MQRTGVQNVGDDALLLQQKVSRDFCASLFGNDWIPQLFTTIRWTCSLQIELTQQQV